MSEEAVEYETTKEDDFKPLEVKAGLQARTVRIRLTEEMLGTVSKNKDVHKDHVQAKVRKMVKEERIEGVTEDDLDQELEDITEVQEKGVTGFLEDDQGIYIGQHMIKGQIKASLEACMAMGAITKIPNYKKWVDQLLHVRPKKLRFIDVHTKDGEFSRPLRGMTAQGPRVTVTKSDVIAEGRELEFTLIIMPNQKNLHWKAVLQALDYGRFVGLGSWRGSGGKGTFELVSYSDPFPVKDFR